jgi:PHD/YefM family antitoxin component YafN of YafNO toxin-antitoxin module
MAYPLRIDAIEALPRTPASDVKKQGWRGVMRSLMRTGKVVVTNHNQPEAVILSTEAYSAMVQALQAANSNMPSPLDALRQRFDERLAALDSVDAADRMRGLFDQPARLDGKVKAGTGY